MSSAAIAIWIQVHKWTSLLCAAFLLMLCVTGLPLIFSDEIGRITNPQPALPGTPAGAEHASLDDIVRDALARRPAGHVTDYLYFPDNDDRRVVVQTAPRHDPALHESHFATYDLWSGAWLSATPETSAGFIYTMRRLHVDMFAGLPGMLFLGTMGLLFVASLVSGTVLYAPFMKKLRFGEIRRRSTRTTWLDIHNLTGIAALVWMLVVGVTGAINTLAEPAEHQWQAQELRAMLAPYKEQAPVRKIASLDRIQATIATAAPDMRIQNIVYPGTALSGPGHFTVFMTGNTPLTSRLLTSALVDGETGQVAELRKMPWYMTTLLLSQPLHFGDYGGIPLKIIWAMLTVMTIIVLGSGVYLWLFRSMRSTTGRPVRQPKSGVEV